MVDEEGEFEVLDGMSPSEPGVRCSGLKAGRRLGVTDHLKIAISNYKATLKFTLSAEMQVGTRLSPPHRSHLSVEREDLVQEAKDLILA